MLMNAIWNHFIKSNFGWKHYAQKRFAQRWILNLFQLNTKASPQGEQLPEDTRKHSLKYFIEVLYVPFSKTGAATCKSEICYFN